MLALDDDTAEFGRRFRSDPLLGRSIRELCRAAAAAAAHGRPGGAPGDLRPADRGAARAGDRAGRDPRLRRAGADAARRSGGSRLPSCGGSGSRPTAPPRSSGSAARVDLERLRELPIEAVEARLLRERGFGRWSLGIVALEGLGSYRHGLVGDLSLVKLCSALRGRWVELAETAELLEPYEEWAGLAGRLPARRLAARPRRRAQARTSPARCASPRAAPPRLRPWSTSGRSRSSAPGKIGEALDRRAALVRLARAGRALGLDPARGARRRAARAHGIEVTQLERGGARRGRRSS